MKKIIVIFTLICLFFCFMGILRATADHGSISAGSVTEEKKVAFVDGFEFADVQWIIDVDKTPGPNLFSNKIENIWKDELG